MKKRLVLFCGAMVLLAVMHLPAVASSEKTISGIQVAWYVAPRGVVVRRPVVVPVVREPVVVAPAPVVVEPTPTVVVTPERVVHPAVRAAGVVRRVNRRRVREAVQ